MMLDALLLLAALVASAALTGVVRRYALAGALLAQPSERGLHANATPSGGGAGFVIVVSTGLATLAAAGRLDAWLATIWIACGLGFALLGWIDDHRQLSVRLRLVCELLLAAVFVASVPSEPLARCVEAHSVLCMVPAALAVVAIVWMVNLFNFMDGADGFAATESVLVAVGGAVLLALYAPGVSVIVAALIGAGSAGFLCWNWHPARIFMGDVGSYFLGFQFAGLLTLGSLDAAGPWVWLILLAPFITDATLTLLRRMLAGERWWQGHRSHVYQLLVLHGWSHTQICVGLIVTTLLVLIPGALLTLHYPAGALVVTVLVYLLAGMMWAALYKHAAHRI